MPSRLSRLLSSSNNKEKEALAEAERSTESQGSSSPPPTYETAPPEYDREHTIVPPDVTAGFKNLSLSSRATDAFPTPDECIAHLKVLECFYRLRQSVGSQDGLFGIHDKVVTESNVAENDKSPELLAKLAEKRWAIYVQRAVDRFETWWAAVTPNSRMTTRAYLERAGPREHLTDPAHADAPSIQFDQSNLPPLDVLMVWHAYMLNPRAYFEDCIRYGRMSLWHTNMPWKATADCVNSESFTFEAGEAAQTHFTSITGLRWTSLADDGAKVISCPDCSAENTTPWTTCFESHPVEPVKSHEDLAAGVDLMLTSGTGFCDKDFQSSCKACNRVMTHDSLKAGKFVNDVKQLLNNDVPMAGTVLGLDGIPWRAFGTSERFMEYWHQTPNELFAAKRHDENKACLGRCILQGRTLDGQIAPIQTMGDIRDLVDQSMKRKSWLRAVRHSMSSTLLRQERIAIRRLMSRYWENSSPFALDLVGAVIRQGSFVEKMHNIDWLHSPALLNTVRRLVVKYERFMTIMAQNKDNMAVPTLDVDLAWHTHQLAPSGYMSYTVKDTKQFIDHDDKVAETKLNDSFAWTSKTYQRMFGEPYSECTCWYCEAIRESHTSGASRLFGGNNARVASMLHGAEQDPRKSVHISAHNAVRPTDETNEYQKDAAKKAAELDRAYRRACERATKKGKPAPKRDDYYYSDAWGYPVYIPAYSPYVGWTPYCPMYYPVTPGCMALGAGSVGNCCSGTCGGGVAAGGCAGGGAGGCAGGAAGGCGGGGG